MTGNVNNYQNYAYHQQADAEAARRAQEYQEAQQRMAEAQKEAQDIAERQRREAERAAADQANRMRWSSQQR